MLNSITIAIIVSLTLQVVSPAHIEHSVVQLLGLDSHVDLGRAEVLWEQEALAGATVRAVVGFLERD